VRRPVPRRPLDRPALPRKRGAIVTAIAGVVLPRTRQIAAPAGVVISALAAAGRVNTNSSFAPGAHRQIAGVLWVMDRSRRRRARAIAPSGIQLALMDRTSGARDDAERPD
jgi:hypothetical protein